MGVEPEMVDPRAAPILVGIAYGATIVASWGFTSLLFDQDVVTAPDAGPLLGPSMALGAVVSTMVWLWGAWRRAGAGAIGAGLGAAASAWFALLLVAGVGYTVTRGELIWLLLFPADYAVSPFTLVPAMLAGLTVGLASALWRRSVGAKSFDRGTGED
jgi:hypothetical protein